MKQVSFEGIGQVMATFPAAQDAQGGEKVAEGIPVKLGATGVVDVCADSDAFIGVARAVRDGCAAVQVRGFVQVKATGSISAGMVNLAADGTGGVKQSSSGKSYLVAETGGETITILL
ncbi:MAG TPA: hypothetical protein H9714_04260 [Candidatus Flavonifractor intestinipullorum]|uniref:DUF2190 family protein n=1 Tax=Candidatus Flavonifractor intestinipullorum TaxID=2838587 RepID=A0A9D2MBS3_9FIRM|nr:hypothetical protein [Candidatus Flavonifractor intestinipullorum]